MLKQQQLNPEQIKAAFAICSRPVKLLIREYFVQFSKNTAKLKNGNKVSPDQIPKEYIDQGKVMEMVTGDSSQDLMDTSVFDFNSLLRIPDGAGHLTVPQKEEDGETVFWSLGLHLGGRNRKFDKKTYDEFAKEGQPTPDDARGRVMQLMMGFYPSAVFVFDYLKTRNKIMETLSLTYKQGASTIIISDSRIPGIRPNKVLYVKLQPNQ